MLTPCAVLALMALRVGSSQTPAEQSLMTDSRVDAIFEAADVRLRRQGDAWFEYGDYPRVVQLLKKRFAMWPTDFEVATDLGWMQENIQEDAAALETYRQFRRNAPLDPDSAYPEASYYYRHRDWARVPPLIEPTLAGKPHGNSWRILAHSYDRMGRLGDSERVWRAYIAVNPTDEAAKRNLERVVAKRRATATPPPAPAPPATPPPR